MRVQSFCVGLFAICLLIDSSVAIASETSVDVKVIAPNVTDLNGSSGTRSVVGSYTEGHTENAVSFISNPVGVATANAAGYSNLATGNLGAYAEANNAYAYSTVRWIDTLTFDVSGADAATVTDLTLNFMLHGILTGAGTGATFTLYANAGTAGMFVITDAIHETRGPEFSYFQTNWKSFAITPSEVADTYFITAVLSLNGANPSLQLANSLNVWAEGNGTADYMHTSSLSLGLPKGVTYTSESGKFLSEVSGVPEPASWAMMLFGFLFVGCIIRDQKGLTPGVFSEKAPT